MEPFNIKIGYEDADVTLTILPIAEHQYKVIYFGAVLGAVQYLTGGWESIPVEELEAGDLPYYQHDSNSDKANLILNESTVDEIGEKIEHSLGTEKDL
jgi:hypothetical protein